MSAVPKPKMQPKPPRQYVKKVNPKRAAIRRARDFGSIAEWLVTLPCFITGRKTGEWTRIQPPTGMEAICVTVVPAHVKSRGSGGRKYANQIPLAAHIHNLQEAHGWERIGLTLKAAREVAKGYQDLFERTFATSDETGDDS